MTQKTLSAISTFVLSYSFLLSSVAVEQANSSKALAKYTANATKRLTSELEALRGGLSKEVDSIIKQLETIKDSGYGTATVDQSITGLREIRLNISDALARMPTQDYYELLAKCTELKEKLEAVNSALNASTDFINTAKSSSPTALKNLNKKRSIGSRIRSKFKRAKDEEDELTTDLQKAGNKLAVEFNAKVQELKQQIIDAKHKAIREVSKKKQKVKNEFNAQRFVRHLMQEVQNNLSGQLSDIIKKAKGNILKAIKKSSDKVALEKMDRQVIVDAVKTSITDKLSAMSAEEKNVTIASIEKAVDDTIDYFVGLS